MQTTHATAVDKIAEAANNWKGSAYHQQLTQRCGNNRVYKAHHHLGMAVSTSHLPGTSPCSYELVYHQDTAGHCHLAELIRGNTRPAQHIPADAEAKPLFSRCHRTVPNLVHDTKAQRIQRVPLQHPNAPQVQHNPLHYDIP